MSEKTIVLVVRDPDYDNSYTVFGPEPQIIDIDLGRSDLSATDEFDGWFSSHMDTVAELRAEGEDAAADAYEQILRDAAPDGWFPGYGEVESALIELAVGQLILIERDDEALMTVSRHLGSTWPYTYRIAGTYRDSGATIDKLFELTRAVEWLGHELDADEITKHFPPQEGDA